MATANTAPGIANTEMATTISVTATPAIQISAQQKSPPLRTMDKDLMFSQRNNPYCDLLKISAAKINFFFDSTKCFKRNLYICSKITKNAKNYEENIRS